jgi:glycosyltransferase involved in cell wall biosynthesis
MDNTQLEVTVVMPCLNEAETLETVIKKAQSCIQEHGLSGEIVIADNGSTDGSQAIAERLGARVVLVEEKGYGCALRGGIEAAKGQFIIMGDADDSYDFSAFFPFIERLRDGAELVMGSRFKGKIMPGAMPWKNQHIGNPIQTKIGQIMFGCPISDFNCGMRGFTKDAYYKMGLVTKTWEFASEMIIKAALRHMRIDEVPITLHKDGRSRPPHLQPWRAGWRNIRFMLLHSPRWLFLIPGLLLTLLGIIGFALVLPGPRPIFGMVFDVTSLVFCATACIVGDQVISLGFLARAFAISQGLLPSTGKPMWFQRHIGLESILVTGILLAFIGFGLLIAAVSIWYHHGFGQLPYESIMRLVVPASTLVAIGIQMGFTGFFLGVLELKRVP